MYRPFMPVILFFATINVSAEPTLPPPVDKPPAIEAPTRPSYRSNADHHLWLGINGGLLGGTWGVNSGGGLGAGSGLELRAQFGRCGGIFSWEHEHIEYFQPDPLSDLHILSAGVSCRITSFGKANRFWHSSQVVGYGLVEYASNTYIIYDRNSELLAQGTSYGWGSRIGADLMVPVYVGFWARAGAAVEELKFHYNIPNNSFKIHETSNPTLSFILRVGISYGFW